MKLQIIRVHIWMTSVIFNDWLVKWDLELK